MTTPITSGSQHLPISIEVLAKMAFMEGGVDKSHAVSSGEVYGGRKTATGGGVQVKPVKGVGVR